MSTKAAPQTESAAMIERLLAAIDVAERRKLIAQHPLLDWDAVVSALTDRARQEINANIQNAQLLADIAATVSEVIGSQVALARSHRAKANALWVGNQKLQTATIRRAVRFGSSTRTGRCDPRGITGRVCITSCSIR